MMWRYEIQYGPEGEANYAWVYFGKEMVCTTKTHHAKTIVAALTPTPSALVEGGEKVQRPERVQAAFEVWRNRDETGPNATAMFQYIEELEHSIATPPSRNDTIRECIAVVDNNYYEKLSAANRWFEQGDQGSAIVCRDQARACRDISTALRALLTDEVRP